MTTTRSTVLFSVFGLQGGPNTVYTVPNGFVAIVKTVAGQNEGNNASFYIVSHIPAGFGGNAFQLHRLTPWNSNEIDYWQTWFVMEPQDSLSVYVDVGGTNIVGYGALLVA